MRHSSSCTRFILLLLLALGATTARADAVDDFVRAQMLKHHIPGLSLAVVKDGQVIKATGYGLANVELNTPAHPQTVYVIASVTKQFTATAIMMLVAEGRIHLEDEITRFVDGLPAAYAHVTIRHLLPHTGGLRDYGAIVLRKDYSDRAVVNLLASLSLAFPPGEKFSYSNTGYVLLGMIVEKVSGKSYWDFFAERIFQPLGMTATHRSGAALSDLIPTDRIVGFGIPTTGQESKQAGKRRNFVHTAGYIQDIFATMVKFS